MVKIYENSGNLLRFTKMVKYLPEFEYFTVFLKNRNFISKIKRSKVTDHAATKLNLKAFLNLLVKKWPFFQFHVTSCTPILCARS